MLLKIVIVLQLLLSLVKCLPGKETRLDILAGGKLLAMSDITNEAYDAAGSRISSIKTDNDAAADRYSLREIGSILGVVLSDKTPPKYQPTGSMCDVSKDMKSRVKSSMARVLNFQNAHDSDYPYMVDFAIGASILQGFDTMYGMHFQELYPIEQWTTNLCHGSGDSQMDSRCRGLVKSFKKPREANKSLSTSIDWSTVGTEKETAFPPLIEKCLDALLGRCEVPSVCELVMFDHQPKSQYMLSHQLLFRILAEDRMDSCGLPKRLVDEAVNERICAKMYRESELIWQLQFDALSLRDLFAENMAFCGHLGYKDFFRMDWIEGLLSWQSKSDYGCFLRDHRKSRIQNNDNSVPRKSTPAEIELGILENNEICSPHFTALGLSALAVAWDYLEHACPV